MFAEFTKYSYLQLYLVIKPQKRFLDVLTNSMPDLSDNSAYFKKI